MTYNIAVCDDCKEELKYVSEIVKKAFNKKEFIYNLNEYTDALKMLIDNSKSSFDIIFLDLNMPVISGMEVASRINELNNSTEIVFVTNCEELVYKAYRFKALGFIRKKYLEEEIYEIIDAFIKIKNNQNRFVIFRDSGVEKKYKLKDIIYMKSDDHYVEIISIHNKCLIRDSLNNIEKEYAQYGFIRIHIRYLVNYLYIYSIEKEAVVLIGGKRLPMSRNKVELVKEKFRCYSRW